MMKKFKLVQKLKQKIYIYETYNSQRFDSTLDTYNFILSENILLDKKYSRGLSNIYSYGCHLE